MPNRGSDRDDGRQVSEHARDLVDAHAARTLHPLTALGLRDAALSHEALDHLLGVALLQLGRSLGSGLRRLLELHAHGVQLGLQLLDLRERRVVDGLGRLVLLAHVERLLSTAIGRRGSRGGPDSARVVEGHVAPEEHPIIGIARDAVSEATRNRVVCAVDRAVAELLDADATRLGNLAEHHAGQLVDAALQRAHVVAVVRAATLAGRLRADDLDDVAVLAVTHQRKHDAHAARLRERREHDLVGRRSQPQRRRGSHARDVGNHVDARFLSACDGAPRLADTGHVATRRVDVQHDDLLTLELRPLHLKPRAEVVDRVERPLDVDHVERTGHRELGRALDERLHVSGVDGHRRRAGHRPTLLLGTSNEVELLHLFDPLSPCVATPEQPRHEAGGLLPLLVVDALFPVALMAREPGRGL